MEAISESLGKVHRGFVHSDIDKMKFKEITSDEFAEICPICQSEMTKGQKYLELGCKHVYH